MRILNWPVQTLTHLFATRLFRLTGVAATSHETGSGDTALAWIGMLALTLLAIAACLLWTVISEVRHRRSEYRTLYAYLRLALRFFLASVLLNYGFSKVFDAQFSPPGLYMLNERFGDSSPMALLWTFMGYSIPYTVFAGLAEAIPGILLLFRRTNTVGALSAAAVLLNVVVLNFCYDVPVKLYSTTFLFISFFLLLPDLNPLWTLLVRHHPAQLSSVSVPHSERRHLRITAHCFRFLAIASLLYSAIAGSYHAWWQTDPTARTQRSTLDDPDSIDGNWIVDTSSGWAPGKEWINLNVGHIRYGSNDFIHVTERNGSQWNVLVSTDPDRTMHFLRKTHTELHWSLNPKGTVILQGTWLNQPATLTMHAAAPSEFPLNTRGFHWVQEYPYNR